MRGYRWWRLFYVALEDFEGELLRSSMADRRFTLDEFLRPAIQIAEVLDNIVCNHERF